MGGGGGEDHWIHCFSTVSEQKEGIEQFENFLAWLVDGATSWELEEPEEGEKQKVEQREEFIHD